ncbi:hypothetical protein CGRA01v4_11749 [Colletotrichum graminicola]|nr:hypothetical protein CGRA01v4_11749 [Colletotrichum graminicola]
MEVREAVAIMKDLEMRGKDRRGRDQKDLDLAVTDPSTAYVGTLAKRFWQIQIRESE